MEIINTVTVIGANGVMGYLASAMFASFGNAKVFMVSRDIQKSKNAIDKAVKSVRADSIRSKLVPCDYSSLKDCVKQSDLVFESVTENIEIKKEITRQVGKYLSRDTIFATGTSGLSINDISSVLSKECQKHYYGMHFFNPPYSMTLLELIPSSLSENVNEVKHYLEKKLLRTVVICNDSPAFLANRIGFQFLNMALQYSERYKEKGGIAYIDSIIGTFTGRSMTPCITADFVGLDVHKAIVDNLHEKVNDYANNTFVLPGYINKLIDEGRLGRKTGCGLFKNDVTEDGKKIRRVYDIQSGEYIQPQVFSFPFAEKMKCYLNNGDYHLAIDVLKNDVSDEAEICRHFLKNYIDYSLHVVGEICDDITLVDDAMATGFNWCPPLSLSNLLFATHYPEKYDYRPFFKAGRSI